MLGTLLVNLQMLSCFSVQCWIYPQKSVYVNHTLVVNYVGLKACITFLSATSLCIGLSIDLAIKTLLVLLSSVAQFQFHVLPGSPIMIVSPAAPAWPLRAFTLWLYRVCGNTQLKWQSGLGHSGSPVVTLLVAVGMILLYILKIFKIFYFILFLI